MCIMVLLMAKSDEQGDQAENGEQKEETNQPAHAKVKIKVSRAHIGDMEGRPRGRMLIVGSLNGHASAIKCLEGMTGRLSVMPTKEIHNCS